VIVGPAITRMKFKNCWGAQRCNYNIGNALNYLGRSLPGLLLPMIHKLAATRSGRNNNENVHSINQFLFVTLIEKRGSVSPEHFHVVEVDSWQRILLLSCSQQRKLDDSFSTYYSNSPWKNFSHHNYRTTEDLWFPRQTCWCNPTSHQRLRAETLRLIQVLLEKYQGVQQPSPHWISPWEWNTIMHNTKRWINRSWKEADSFYGYSKHIVLW